MVASLRFDFLSHKQLRVVVRKVYERLVASELSGMVKDRLALVKFVVRDKAEKFIQEEVDRQTEAAFGELFDAGRIQFFLECAECRFEIPSSVTIYSKGPLVPLTHDDGGPVEKSLFDFVESESHNEYERAVALVLDKHADVLWWYRNCVGAENFTVQGYRRQKIYPDFVVQGTHQGKPYHRVIVIESKGKHLEGNPDTAYKRKVANYFTKAGKKVTWQQLGQDFKDHVFRFQILDEAQDHGRDWKDELREMLTG
jgi:type III restriction enzyme